MENRGGDFAAAAAFLNDTDADEARIEGGQGGECPRMGGGVRVVFGRARLAENVQPLDSQRLACSARGDDAVQQDRKSVV